jgi:hypothetical protein
MWVWCRVRKCRWMYIALYALYHRMAQDYKVNPYVFKRDGPYKTCNS